MSKDLILQLWLNKSLDNVKKRLGKECTYLSFEEWSGKLFFKAHLGKDRVRVQINTTLDKIQPKEFEDLFNLLNQRLYDTPKTV